jgi:GNAT superfamily N-acetyltransferase
VTGGLRRTLGSLRQRRLTVRIRDAAPAETPLLEALQRRSSNVWDEYRERLRANPDAIELAQTFVDNGWVRVAVDCGGTPAGFAVVIPAVGGVHELDGLFVEPAQMHCGVGRALVQDACRRAQAAGALLLEVVAGPARGFYEKLGFEVVATAETRFGPAVRMRRRL